MDRPEAVALLKELFDNCPFLEGKSFALMPPNADSVLSKNYQLHIKANLDETSILCIEKIAHKRDLTVNNKGSLVVIYRPLKK